jgi:hypothetical protein
MKTWPHAACAAGTARAGFSSPSAEEMWSYRLPSIHTSSLVQTAVQSCTFRPQGRLRRTGTPNCCRFGMRRNSPEASWAIWGPGHRCMPDLQTADRVGRPVQNRMLRRKKGTLRPSGHKSRTMPEVSLAMWDPGHRCRPFRTAAFQIGTSDRSRRLRRTGAHPGPGVDIRRIPKDGLWADRRAKESPRWVPVAWLSSEPGVPRSLRQRC